MAEWFKASDLRINKNLLIPIRGVGSNPTSGTIFFEDESNKKQTLWRNGSASDSRSEGYVFKSRQSQF